MTANQYIWQNRKLVPWEEAKTHVLTHSLHYGSGAFEGLRCYKTQLGPAIFKLEQHIERLFYSAQHLGMKIPYTVEEICEGVIATLQANQQEEAYIRPLAFYGYGKLKVAPSPDLPVDVIIATWPWAEYMPVKAVDITVSPYIRIHPKSTVPDAKISGHYVNSILAGLSIQNSHYHDALLLDDQGFVAEGTAANIFIVKEGKIITPPPGTILIGITRNTVIEIAEELGIPVEQRMFKPEEIYSADEAFYSGTAVEITAIRSLDDRIIGKDEIGAITQKIKERYLQIVRGEVAQCHADLTFVNGKNE